MEARQYSSSEENIIHCNLCNHRCRINESRTGICGVRRNTGGILQAETYAKVSAEAIDPIEKKPLYHFLPGSLSYSLGSIGCNFSCSHCQNWHISQADPLHSYVKTISPEEAVGRAIANKCASLSWTYNEPTLWYEYTQDTGKIAQTRGLKTVYVTNGYMTTEALTELSPFLNAWRVDIKAFSEDFYRTVCRAHLQPVLNSTLYAKELGLHVEIIYLVIPDLNDSEGEIDAFIEWVIESLGPETPVHFTRFHPDYRMQDKIATPVKTLERSYETAKSKGLLFPYLGNVPGHRYENTWCPHCNNLLIGRSRYAIGPFNLDNDQCIHCGEKLEFFYR